jgi:hypothetical protein
MPRHASFCIPTSIANDTLLVEDLHTMLWSCLSQRFPVALERSITKCDGYALESFCERIVFRVHFGSEQSFRRRPRRTVAQSEYRGKVVGNVGGYPTNQK